LEFNVPFQHKYGYIRHEVVLEKRPLNGCSSSSYYELLISRRSGMISMNCPVCWLHLINNALYKSETDHVIIEEGEMSFFLEIHYSQLALQLC